MVSDNKSADFIFTGQNSVSFHTFMERALYHPERGYYCQEHPPQGKKGDYVTAPTLGDLFAQCLTRTLAPLLQENPDWSIAELGPSNGTLAIGLLTSLWQANILPKHYYCIDPALHLHHRREKLVQKQIGSHYQNLTWHKTLPPSFKGIVLANEVLDALPVHLLQTDDQKNFTSVKVANNNQKDPLHQSAPDPSILAHLNERAITHHPNYRYEISTAIPNLIQQLSEKISQGICLFFDYGYPRSLFYHPQRNLGTLTSFKNHRTLQDICAQPGTQDISAHVDFTLVAESAHQAGMHLQGFTNQEQFLLANDLPLFLQNSPQLRPQAHILTSPYEMGELIKVMALSKNMPQKVSLRGFRFGNQRL
jgi:SAM-dependent MidA family methyltransferase